MKILMIGNSGAGKTTYMASAYHALQKSVYGFSLDAESGEKRWLEILYSDLLQGQYPPMSISRKEYNMKLKYYQKEILDFVWNDYRGKIIGEVGGEADDLEKDIMESDGVMLFFDSESLYKGDKQTSRVRRILNLITKKLLTVETLYTVIVVLTKFDLVSGKASISDLCSDLYEFENSIKQKEGVYYKTIPVSCTPGSFVNVDLPLLDILHSGIYINYILTGLLAQQTLEEAKKYYNDRSFIDWGLSRLFGVKTNGEIAIEKAEQAKALIEAFDELKIPFEQLSAYISNYDIQIPLSNSNNKQGNYKRKYKF